MESIMDSEKKITEKIGENALTMKEEPKLGTSTLIELKQEMELCQTDLFLTKIKTEPDLNIDEENDFNEVDCGVVNGNENISIKKETEFSMMNIEAEDYVNIEKEFKEEHFQDNIDSMLKEVGFKKEPDLSDINDETFQLKQSSSKITTKTTVPSNQSDDTFQPVFTGRQYQRKRKLSLQTKVKTEFNSEDLQINSNKKHCEKIEKNSPCIDYSNSTSRSINIMLNSDSILSRSTNDSIKELKNEMLSINEKQTEISTITNIMSLITDEPNIVVNEIPFLKITEERGPNIDFKYKTQEVECLKPKFEGKQYQRTGNKYSRKINILKPKFEGKQYQRNTNKLNQKDENSLVDHNYITLNTTLDKSQVPDIKKCWLAVTRADTIPKSEPSFELLPEAAENNSSNEHNNDVTLYDIYRGKYLGQNVQSIDANITYYYSNAEDKHNTKNEMIEVPIEVQSSENTPKKTFSKNFLLDYREQLIKSNERMFPCNLCNYKGNTMICLEEHKLTHAIEDLFKCKFCHYKFQTLDALEKHKVMHQTVEYTCDQCDFVTNKQATLKKHKLMGHSSGRFVCDICGFSSYEEEKYEEHKYIWHSGKPLKCRYCKFRAEDKEELRKHKATHDKDRVLKCDHCNYKCCFPSSLSRHQLKHTNEKIYKCDVCDAEYKQFYSLKLHKQVHSESAKSYSCKQCDFTTTRKNEIGKHHIIHATTVYKCNDCDYQTPRFGHLKQHQITHSSEHYYHCKMCIFKSRYMCSLKKHELIHFNTKSPFTCNLCYLPFNDETQLEEHLRQCDGESKEQPSESKVLIEPADIKEEIMENKPMSQGAAVYRCNRCDYKSHSSSNLLRHKVSHISYTSKELDEL